MASTKTGRNSLPERFRPFFDQAMVQSQLRYGGQEAGLSAILAQLTNDYGRQSTAQSHAGMSVLGALKGADQGLKQVYADAGLTPNVLGQIANSPTGQRLAGEFASNRADVQQQLTGAQAGQQYIQQSLYDKLQESVGQVSSQSQQLAQERGLYTGSVLDELIGNDRAARSAANAAARKQAADDAQAGLDRATQTGNALIGQGITPVIGADGSVSLGDPLPGGKADPNAPGNKPKTKQNRATNTERKGFSTDFSKALGMAQRAIVTPEDKRSKALRRSTGQDILNGYDESGGEPIHDTRKTIKENGRDVPNPNYGKPVLNSDGTPKTKDKIEGQEGIANQVAVQAALDIAFDGALSRETVKKLHALGIKTTDLGTVKTQTQLAREKKNKPKYTLPVNTRPVTSPRDQQPG